MSRRSFWNVMLIALLVTLSGCTRSFGPIRPGMSRDEIRKAFGNPASRVNELTGDNDELCLTLGNKRPQLVERWTYTVVGADNAADQLMNIYFDRNGKLIGTLMSPASQPATTQP